MTHSKHTPIQHIRRKPTNGHHHTPHQTSHGRKLAMSDRSEPAIGRVRTKLIILYKLSSRGSHSLHLAAIHQLVDILSFHRRNVSMYGVINESFPRAAIFSARTSH